MLHILDISILHDELINTEASLANNCSCICKAREEFWRYTSENLLVSIILSVSHANALVDLAFSLIALPWVHIRKFVQNQLDNSRASRKGKTCGQLYSMLLPYRRKSLF